MYIYKINILIKDKDNLLLENALEDAIERSIQNDSICELVSSQIVNLENRNYGKCVKCGAWTSDSTSDMFVSELSPGRKINGEWYCDICLPKTDLLSF